jgi:hydrogenase nickel incorporation protein HypA/HybF
MHEYGLMADVVNQALDTCRCREDSEAVRVRVEVGEFAFASRESLEAAFEVLTRGTPLEGAHLEILEVPGRATCEACGFAGSAADLDPDVSEPPAVLLCPRCGYPLFVTAGAGVTLADVQLQDRGHPASPSASCGGR